MKQKIEIIYNDADLVVVNKPANFLSIPDRFDETKPNLRTFLAKRFEEVYTVHRLDKETSGIICFAKNQTAHKHLSEQFQQRTIEKVYLTLIDGHIYPPEGKIDQAIAPHPAKPGKMMVTNKGKTSLTLYKVIEEFDNFSLVEANIKTGRTHQIRVHFESIGYPLSIDKLYGTRDAFYLSEIKRKKYKLGKDQTERPLMTRTTLHSSKLAFIHPSTQEKLFLEAPLPKDFAAIVKQLRKWNR